MRKLFWQTLVALDGFVEGANRELNWFVIDDDFDRYVIKMLDSIADRRRTPRAKRRAAFARHVPIWGSKVFFPTASS